MGEQALRRDDVKLMHGAGHRYMQQGEDIGWLVMASVEAAFADLHRR